jgi:hypothetical protein
MATAGVRLGYLSARLGHADVAVTVLVADHDQTRKPSISLRNRGAALVDATGLEPPTAWV